MKILNRYIAKQIFIGFLLVSFSLLAMLWLTQSLRFVEMVTRQGLPVYLFAEMTSLLMPRIFNVLSPIAAFVAVLFVYNRMINDRELVAMQAAGISPWKSASAAVSIGILLALFNIYVMNWGIPQAEKTFRDLEWRVKNNITQMMFREGEFTTLKNGITIFIDKHEDDGSVSGIFVSDESKPNKKITLTAEKGRLIQSDTGPRILFINGVRQEMDKKTFKFNSLTFTRYSAEFNTSSSSKKKNQTVREKNIFELLSSGDNPTLSLSDKRRNIVEGNRRIIYPWYNLLFALFACVGLLISNFNRRGQTHIIAVEVMFMILICAGDLAFTNLANRSLYMLPFLYLNLLIPLFVCLYLLIFYNPFYFYHQSAKRNLKNAH
ncbi:MAG: LPS export ABC transporter permease LptF [Alphaproteobacteria bacterium]|nr:LPS export ABC transporter permease LptF [Alphaproteobacteria bacterium]